MLTEIHAMVLSLPSIPSVSCACIVLVLWLTIDKIMWYAGTELIETMGVDDSVNATIRIHLDIMLPATPCSAIAVDAADDSGAPHADVEHHIVKRRVNAAGAAFGAAERHQLGLSLKTQDELHAERVKTAEQAPAVVDGQEQESVEAAELAAGLEPECGNCYGAGAEGECCNTCQDVRKAYNARGWSFDPSAVSQCAKEGFMQTLRSQESEGCNVYGYMDVPKVPGSFHLGPAHSFAHAHPHVEDLTEFTLRTWNSSHGIASLTFGRLLPHVQPPLKGATRTLATDAPPGAHQYYLTAVPTTYKYAKPTATGQVIEAHQYSVTEHFRRMDLPDAKGLPGIWFYYRFSPIAVSVEEYSRSFGHLLSGLIALAGGVYSVLGLLDSALYRSMLGWSRKNLGGMLG